MGIFKKKDYLGVVKTEKMKQTDLPFLSFFLSFLFFSFLFFSFLSFFLSFFLYFFLPSFFFSLS